MTDTTAHEPYRPTGQTSEPGDELGLSPAAFAAAGGPAAAASALEQPACHPRTALIRHW